MYVVGPGKIIDDLVGVDGEERKVTVATAGASLNYPNFIRDRTLKLLKSLKDTYRRKIDGGTATNVHQLAKRE